MISALTVAGLVVGGSGVGAAQAGERGGWAATVLDPVGRFRAGEPKEVRFWVLQHGFHPYWKGSMGEEKLGAVRLRFTRDARELAFDARPLREPGHYVADVELPADGTYTVLSDQGVFQSFDIGTVTVPGSLKLIPREHPDEKTAARYRKQWGAVHPPAFYSTPVPLPQDPALTQPPPSQAALAPPPPAPGRKDQPIPPAVLGTATLTMAALLVATLLVRRRRHPAPAPRRELIG
ncbi:hypothetical protein [Actinocorallia lasiicapitis]